MARKNRISASAELLVGALRERTWGCRRVACDPKVAESVLREEAKSR